MTGIVTDELLIDKVFRICGSIIINNYLPNSDFIKLLSTSHNLYNILIHMAFKKIEFPLECVLKLKDHKLEQYRTNIRNIIISINSSNGRLSEQSIKLYILFFGTFSNFWTYWFILCGGFIVRHIE